MTTKNQPIGVVECPAKKCTRQVPVFRFRPRPTERMQRFANKLYCRCPVHGKFGGDAGDDEMQTYIEENSTKCESDDAGKVAGNTTSEQPATPEPKTVTPLQKLPATPATKTPAMPATEPAQTPAKKSLWWGLDL